MTEPREVMLTEEACRELLSRNHFGRVAVNDARGPVVFPVNYAFHDGTVVFRSDTGTKLEAAVQGASASFQIDQVDEQRRLGWSVLVRGRVAAVDDEGELAALRELPLEPFVGGEKVHYVKLVDAELSGRRIPLPRQTPQGWFAQPEGNIWYGQDATDLLG